MLKNIVGEIGGIRSSTAGSDCIACNDSGIIAVLGEKELFLVTPGYSEGLGKVKIHLMSDSQSFKESDLCSFSSIAFNANGSILLLWGRDIIAYTDLSNCIAALIASPQAESLHAIVNIVADKNSCSLLENAAMSNSSSAIKLLKVSWHPMFSDDIVALLSSNHVLVHSLSLHRFCSLHPDISIKTRPFALISLDTVEPITSFHFGGLSSWNRLSVFMVGLSQTRASAVSKGSTVKEVSLHSRVYTLCPFIPMFLEFSSILSDIFRLQVESINKTMTCARVFEFISLQIKRVLGFEYLDQLLRSLEDISVEDSQQAYLQIIREFLEILKFSVEYNWIEQSALKRLSAYRPSLQGPFKVENSAVLENMENTASVCDLCVLDIAQDDLNEVVPAVFLIAYNCGIVGVHILADAVYPMFQQELFDSLESDAVRGIKRLGLDGDEGVTISSRAARLLRTPTLINVEVCRLSKTLNGGEWKFLLDPVYPYSVFAIDRQEGVCCSIRLQWLKSLWFRQKLDSLSIVEALGAHKSVCIPVYSADLLVDKTAKKGCILGVALLSNTLLGHSLVLKISGAQEFCLSVNISLHEKLFDYSNQHQANVVVPASAGRTYGDLFDASIVSSLKIAREAIATIPKPVPTDKQSAAEFLKQVSDASLRLEESVVDPLHDVAQRLKFKLELVKELYGKQVEVLEGVAGNRADEQCNEQIKQTEVLSMIKQYGVKAVLQRVMRRQAILVKKCEAISETFTVQKELVESSLAQVMYNHTHKLMPEEKIFQKDLIRLRQKALLLDGCIHNLSAQSKSLKCVNLSPIGKELTPTQPKAGHTVVETPVKSKTLAGADQWYQRNARTARRTPGLSSVSTLRTPLRMSGTPITYPSTPGSATKLGVIPIRIDYDDENSMLNCSHIEPGGKANLHTEGSVNFKKNEIDFLKELLVEQTKELKTFSSDLRALEENLSK